MFCSPLLIRKASSVILSKVILYGGVIDSVSSACCCYYRFVLVKVGRMSNSNGLTKNMFHSSLLMHFGYQLNSMRYAFSSINLCSLILWSISGFLYSEGGSSVAPEHSVMGLPKMCSILHC